MFDVWNSIATLGQPCLSKPVPECATDSDGIVKDSVLKSIDATLWEEIERGCLESPLPAFQNEELYTTDRWLTTSAFQKCIRRGYLDSAQRYARSGIRLDADHTFRRLAIIALEDVGLGDLKLIAATLAVLGDKRRRQRIGEELLAAYLATQMSRAIKSRLACETLSLVEYNPAVPSLASALLDLSHTRLSQIISSEKLASTRQMVALMLLHGTNRLTSRTIPPVGGAGHRELLKLLSNHRTALIFHYIVRKGLSRCRDSLVVPYAILAQFASQTSFFQISRNELNHPEMIGSYPSIAYDMHTRSGRKAIRDFEVNCTDQLRSSGVVSTANLVFALEGGLLDRQLNHDQINEIANKAMQFEIFEEATNLRSAQLLRLKLPSNLNFYRRQAASSI